MILATEFNDFLADYEGHEYDYIVYQMRNCGCYIMMNPSGIEVYQIKSENCLCDVDESNYKHAGNLIYAIENYHGFYPVGTGHHGQVDRHGECMLVSLRDDSSNEIGQHRYVKIIGGCDGPFIHEHCLCTHAEQLQCAYNVKSSEDGGTLYAIGDEKVYMFDCSDQMIVFGKLEFALEYPHVMNIFEEKHKLRIREADRLDEPCMKKKKL